jgi:8-oxo-dGTP diphosphatase
MKLVVTIATAHQADPPRAGMGITLESDQLTVRRISQGAGSASVEQAQLMALIRSLEEVNRNQPQQVIIHTEAEWLRGHLLEAQPSPDDRALAEGLSRARKQLRELAFEFRFEPISPDHPASQLAQQALASSPGQFSNFLGGPVRFGSEGAQSATATPEALQMSAGGVVFKREKNKYKVCLVSKRGGRIWALPKGRVDKGETYEQTAEREILEETGHRTQAIDKLHEIEYYFFLKETQTLYHKFVFFYLMQLVEENATPRDGEADEVAWFEISEAYRKLSYINEKNALKKAQKILR